MTLQVVRRYQPYIAGARRLPYTANSAIGTTLIVDVEPVPRYALRHRTVVQPLLIPGPRQTPVAPATRRPDPIVVIPPVRSPQRLLGRGWAILYEAHREAPPSETPPGESLDASMLPGGMNLYENPSFRAAIPGAGNTAGITATSALDTAVGWDGPHSFRMDVTASTSDGAYRFANLTTALGSITPGAVYSAAIRYKRSNTIGTTALVTFRDAADASLGLAGTLIPLANGAMGDFAVAYLSDLVAPAGASKMRIEVRAVAIAAGATGSVWWDGVHMGPGADARYYIDGEQGEDYHWNGAANSSTSYRDAVPAVGLTGYGGILQVSTRVYRSDVLGAEYDDLTAYVTGGRIDHDVDRDIKCTCALSVTDHAQFPLFGWVKVYQDIQREGESLDSHPVGVFRLDEARVTWPIGTAEVPGRDPTVLLAEYAFDDVYNIASGTYVDAVRELLDLVGLTRHAVVDDDRELPDGGVSWQPGDSALGAVNQLLAAIGYYSIYADDTGMPIGLPFRDRLSVIPNHTYVVGTYSDMYGDVAEERTANEVYNRVVVYRPATPGVAALSAVADLPDEHPYSFANRGFYRVKSVAFVDAADQAAIDARASEEIQQVGMLRALMVDVAPHHHEAHEVADFDFTAIGASHLNGRYYIDSASFGLVGTDALMSYRVRRIEG